MPSTTKKEKLLEAIAEAGGLRRGVAAQVAKQLDVPEAEVYGAGSFYHLLSDPETKLRVCTGLSCSMRGARKLLDIASKAGMPVAEVSCLAACDQAPAILKDRTVLSAVSEFSFREAEGDWKKVEGSVLSETWRGQVGPDDVGHASSLAMNLRAQPNYEGKAFARAKLDGAESVIQALEDSGLQGRGGAGFPAAIKWRGVRAEKETTRYVVLNADEGEPGTFKDRDLMLHRPDLVIEGLAIAALTLGASDVYLYLRAAFEGPWKALEGAIAAFAKSKTFEGITFHLHSGHGAYICGEETALLEALEGKRGMPRLKPPFPTQHGLWGKPTLIQNVETIACVPSILLRGGAWFKALGKTEPGTKLYSISGDVAKAGTYEMPLGSSLDELLKEAGGVVGELFAFSPGGASSGFLPRRESGRALDFKGLSEVGSMLGSAGVVVLNTKANIVEAVREQLVFFEVESCGQCAPCRIGTRFLREALDRGKRETYTSKSLAQVTETAWEMNEGSICGLGQAAALPLSSALKYFPEAFGIPNKEGKE